MREDIRQNPWDFYVGSQTPAEFARLVRAEGKTLADGVADYVRAMPGMGMPLTEDDGDEFEVECALLGYLLKNGFED